MKKSTLQYMDGSSFAPSKYTLIMCVCVSIVTHTHILIVSMSRMNGKKKHTHNSV